MECREHTSMDGRDIPEDVLDSFIVIVKPSRGPTAPEPIVSREPDHFIPSSFGINTQRCVRI